MNQVATQSLGQAAVDEFARWRRAVAGEALELERGNPPSGYFRRVAGEGRFEAIGIWRDRENGSVQCFRTVYGDGSKMDVSEIDELFADRNMLAIPYDVFDSVALNGGEWPEIYTVKIRTKDMIAGIRWTEAWAREQLAAKAIADETTPSVAEAVMAAIDTGYMAAPLAKQLEQAVAGLGHNNPPADLAPDAALEARLMTSADNLSAALAAMGGAPKTKAEADQVANYAAKFKDFANEATQAHKVEKEPHLVAGRAVDSKWFPVRDKAESFRKRALTIADAWINAEKARRNEEARAANEAARKQAEREARISGDPPAPIVEVVAEKVKIGSARTISQKIGKVWAVTDAPAFAAYLLGLDAIPADLSEALDKLARKLGAAGVKAPGIELQEKVSTS